MSTSTLTEPQTTTPHPAATPTAPALSAQGVTVIERRDGWRLANWRELGAYRDLFLFLVWRKIKVRYAQSAIGIGWAIIQPVFSAVVFTIVFGMFAEIDSDGAPYALFSFVAVVPWTYFSNAVTEGVSSLVGEANMIRKVYFPRLLMPLSSVAAKFVDFLIALVCLAVIMACWQQAPTWNVVWLPLLAVLMVAAAAAVSIWLTALAVQYRDVAYAISFIIQLGMYASPVVYPTSNVPAEFRLAYAINPMVGVIEGFRAALLGTQPMPWDLIAVGAGVTLVLGVTGLAFFTSRESSFADVA